MPVLDHLHDWQSTNGGYRCGLCAATVSDSDVNNSRFGRTPTGAFTSKSRSLVLGTNGHPLWSATSPSSWYGVWATAMQNAGCKVLRFDLDYANLAGTGSSGGGNLAALVTVLSAHNITPYVMLGSSGGLWTPPVAATYATAAGTVAAALPAGSYIEVWNEPNIAQFWNNAVNATDYATLLDTAYPAIKAANSQVRVAGGVVAYNTTAFRQAILAANPRFDAWSFHPYTTPAPGLSPDDRSQSTYSVVQTIEDTITDLRAVGRGNAELILSEYGWVCSGANASLDGQSAQYYALTKRIARQYPTVSTLLAYHNGDRTGSGAETTSSLLASGQVPTLSWLSHFYG